jgi:crossover junction endodeoxyribonuclease RuvC
MIILGVDPGTLVTGYGVIETQANGSQMQVIEYGTIESKRIASLPLRLHAIFIRLSAVIERSTPDELAIESVFYHKNVQSTLKLGHARGVAILAGVLKELPASEYAPREIKRAVVGNGNASKDQVEFMVRAILNLKASDKKLPDAYDALAVAITHAARFGKPGKKSWKNWKQFAEENPERIKQ